MTLRNALIASLFLLFGASPGVWSQTISVGGTVVDGDMPLPGVSVTVKGSYAGTATDLDGKFALTAESGATLVFSYIGYLRQELTVANTVSDLTVTLKPDVAGLEEAVVIGYGNQQRSKISGAVTTVDIKEATSIPVLRTEQALQGRAAGVQVTQNSGQPGSSQTIRIRGLGSINNSDPLFIVDGIPSGGIDYLTFGHREHQHLEGCGVHVHLRCAWCERGCVDHHQGLARQQGHVDLRQLHRHSGALEVHGAVECRRVRDAHERKPRCGRFVGVARFGKSKLPWAGNQLAGRHVPTCTDVQPQCVVYQWHRDVEHCDGRKPLSRRHHRRGEGRGRTTFVNAEQQAGDRFKVGQNVAFTNIKRSACGEQQFATPVVRALNMDRSLQLVLTALTRTPTT